MFVVFIERFLKDLSLEQKAHATFSKRGKTILKAHDSIFIYEIDEIIKEN